MPTIIQIASCAILLATYCSNVYEAFVRGGDVRTLAIGAVEVLHHRPDLPQLRADLPGRDHDVYNQVAEFIRRSDPVGWMSSTPGDATSPAIPECEYLAELSGAWLWVL
jgi:hypothetical protein